MATAKARLLLLLCTVAAVLTCSWAFSMVGRTTVSLERTTTSSRRSVAAHSPLFASRTSTRPATSLILRATDDNAPVTTDINGDDELEDDDDDEVESQGGILKILFISVPLFCKFCIVLIIKFLTDLVVYPLLWLYRLAHLIKIRTLRFFGIDPRKKSTPSNEGTWWWLNPVSNLVWLVATPSLVEKAGILSGTRIPMWHTYLNNTYDIDVYSYRISFIINNVTFPSNSIFVFAASIASVRAACCVCSLACLPFYFMMLLESWNTSTN